jgi:hypothetical protein
MPFSSLPRLSAFSLTLPRLWHFGYSIVVTAFLGWIWLLCTMLRLLRFLSLPPLLNSSRISNLLSFSTHVFKLKLGDQLRFC